MPNQTPASAALRPEISRLLDEYRDAIRRSGWDSEAGLAEGRSRVALEALLGEYVADAARLNWLDEKRHFSQIRPGVNRIGVSVGGWCWSRVVGGVEELALTLREAIDAARTPAPATEPDR